MNPKEDITIKLIAVVALIYALSMLTGMVLKIELSHLTVASPIVSSVTTQSTKTEISLIYIAEIIIGILVTTALLIILKNRKKSIRRFYEIYSGVLVATGTFFLINIWLGLLIPLSAFFLAIIGAIAILGLYVFRRLSFFNLFGIIIAIAFGAYLGNFLTPLLAFIMLTILAIYDYIAVFISKTMLTLVSIVTGEGQPLPMMIVVGDMDKIQNKLKGTSCGNCYEFMEKSYEDDLETEYKCINCGRISKLYKKGNKPNVINDGDKGKRKPPPAMALGLGDLFLPAAVLVSLAAFGTYIQTAVFLGAMAGIIANFLVLRKLRRPLPALPLIWIGMVIAFYLAII